MEVREIIYLRPAGCGDAPAILDLQRRAFDALLEKYQDYDASPAMESMEVLQWKLASSERDFYFIMEDARTAGMVCVKRLTKNHCISPIGLLPEFQGRGIGRTAVEQLEKRYPDCLRWELGTIMQEQKLCQFYESLGYRRTGEITPVKPGMDIIGYEKSIEKDDNNGSLRGTAS